VQIRNKVTNEPPCAELVDAYLTEIARGYSLDWTPPALLSLPSNAPDGFEFPEPAEVSI
jgi:hypothetical protein